MTKDYEEKIGAASAKLQKATERNNEFKNSTVFNELPIYFPKNCDQIRKLMLDEIAKDLMIAQKEYDEL